MSALAEASERLTAWLFDSALPLWWERGADQDGGGFHDALDANGAPASDRKRARVQTRQAYVYAEAGRLGWRGPWREALAHGLGFFLEHYPRPAGLYRATPTDGDDAAPWLYDQAFALFAMAHAAPAGLRADEMMARSRELVRALGALRLPEGGFREPGGEIDRQSNPHMHLFEAALAWEALDRGGPWSELADELANLAMARFIDSNGRLHEFFGPGWVFAEGIEGRIVEPGHQFEWAWLLSRWANLRGGSDALDAARRLYRTGLAGVDRARGVANQQLLDDLTVHDPVARLWPQTEWIKAALAMGDEAEALNAVGGLELYLDKAEPGLWRDKLRPDGSFVDEPAPASSFYHIVVAISELRAYLDAKGG